MINYFLKASAEEENTDEVNSIFTALPNL